MSYPVGAKTHCTVYINYKITTKSFLSARALETMNGGIAIAIVMAHHIGHALLSSMQKSNDFNIHCVLCRINTVVTQVYGAKLRDYGTKTGK